MFNLKLLQETECRLRPEWMKTSCCIVHLLSKIQDEDSRWIHWKWHSAILSMACQRTTFWQRWRTLHWGRKEEYDGQSGAWSQCSSSCRDTYLLDTSVSHHCNMTASNLPINGTFFPFFPSFLVFMVPLLCYSCLYIWLLVALHLPFLPEQRMINAVQPCLQLTQHTDRVG